MVTDAVEKPGSEPGMATHAEFASVQPASAAMPSEEIEHTALLILQALDTARSGVYPDEASIERLEPHVEKMKARYGDLRGRSFSEAYQVSRVEFIRDTMAALFAPILAEKAERDAYEARLVETTKWLVELADNPPEPTEALRKLFDDYKASGIKSVGLDSPFNACCHRDECRVLEARALAAEAALAAERANAVDGSIDIRLDNKGGVDEIFGNGVLCHIERMNKGEWFVIMTRPDQSQEAFWLTGKGKVEITLHEHRKAPTTGPNVEPWTIAAAIRAQGE